MKKNFTMIIFSIVLVSFLATTGCEKKDTLSSQNKQKIEKLTPSDSKDNNVELELYFDASKNNEKVDLTKEERLINTDELLGELTVHELIKGPYLNSKLNPVLPKNTRLLSFSIDNKIAYVNLSKEALTNMPPTKEEACVKSMVWSLTSLRGIEKVKFLIENKDIHHSLKNIDISKPLSRSDFNPAKNK